MADASFWCGDVDGSLEQWHRGMDWVLGLLRWVHRWRKATCRQHEGERRMTKGSPIESRGADARCCGKLTQAKMVLC